MSRLAGIAVLSTLIVAGSARAEEKENLRDEVLAIVLNVQGCDQQVPYFERAATLAQKQKEPWWAAAAYGAIASCYSEKDDTAQALAYLEKAVTFGFDDCWAMNNDESLKKLRGQPRFEALRAKMKMSPADLHEVLWLISEVQSISHDTSMMITENMNRQDTSFTVIPMSALPDHETSNQTVGVMRMLISGMQVWQRTMVMTSDQSRISHLTNMTIIGNMGTGGGGVDAATAARSAQIAEAAARRRLQAINQRAYKRPSASRTPVSCSKL